MDILGPFPPSESGNRYVLLMIDQFTKWVEIHAIPDQTAVHTAKIAVDNFFSRFGAPLQIHTDQGKNFDGHVMKALCSLYRITKTTQLHIVPPPMVRLNVTIGYFCSSFDVSAELGRKLGMKISSFWLGQ